MVAANIGGDANATFGGSEYDGQLFNAPTLAAGKLGNSYWFNTATKHSIIVNNTNGIFDFENNNYSINFWAYTSIDASAQGLIAHQNISNGGGGGLEGWYIRDNVGGTIKYEVNQTIDIDSPNAVGLNEWNMITISRNSTNTTLYINGTFEKSGGIHHVGAIPNGNLSFGKVFNDEPWYLTGSIDEVSIWNRSLTEEEITELYSSGEGLTYTSIIIQNSQTYNITTTETNSETFVINITYNSTRFNSSAQLFYDGTAYEGTKAGTGDNIEFTRTLDDLTTGAKTFYWAFNLTNSTGSYKTNSSSKTQTVNDFVLGLCNATLTTPYVNFTFKDEENNAVMDRVRVDSSSWSYWLNGRTSKTLSFSTTTYNSSYAFCLTPTYEDINVNLTFKYSNDTYPQRTHTLGSTALTNSTTNTILYLLSSSDGIYSSISVVETSGAAIQGVLLTIEREINNVWTIIGQQETGSDGLATFWVNPNYPHKITAVKTGYLSTTVTISPSQSLYTLSLGTSTSSASYTSSIPGLRWALYPGSGALEPGSHNFNVTITSSSLNLEGCKLEIINASNISQVLASGTDNTNISYCHVSFDYTVVKDLNIFGRLSVDTTNTTGYVIVDADWKWIIIDIDVKAWRTITSFFGDFKSISEFGEGNEGEFSRIIIFFVLTTIFVGMFAYFSGIELSSPGMSILIIWILVIIASVGGFLSVDSGSDNIGIFTEQFGFLIIMTLFILGYGINIFRRANE